MGNFNSWAMASAMPPLAVLSSLASTTPVTPAVSLNLYAWERAFWPVVASSTNRVSWGAWWTCLAATLRILANSCIRLYCVCKRPAVSMMTTLACRRPKAVRMASKTTAPGSLPGWWAITSAPTRSPHTLSWSMAAARKVSAAARTTRSPRSLCHLASLAMVVVLPEPFTPTTSTTLSWRLSASGK